jgi:hypothetical protein
MKNKPRSIFPMPKAATPLEQAGIQVVETTAIGIIAAVAGLILFWALTSTLEDIETLYAGAIFCLLLAGIAALAHTGRPRPAAWLLSGLMAALVVYTMYDYGPATMSNAGYLIPIILAGLALGWREGLGFALAGSLAVWAISFASANSAIQTAIPYAESDLSFNAPMLTLIYLLVASMTGAWSRALNGQ